ncbi:hypothetical protein HanXRQr2_Chr10g0425501 [Helianthus annuus]|uniref:Uncharacterized protein n=1 Tax=Helianthus annuus TaxID=4232 RepID=A0A9K3N2Y1_HELAN|nr:hypothetical protein HanXRQr2_Chr10g0425501 [Helianthus annuus]KAJ0528887.1 hypothetical protein HanHA89_Chr10g0371411 [Helianthus annuus]KAJ0695802.1 hypothetical protein HanLR1_Chr10g0349631 [Helianthus annuus]
MAHNYDTIHGSESPPAVVFGDSPVNEPIIPENVKGKGPEKVVEADNVVEWMKTTLPGMGIRERVESLETDVESSETPPPVTKYTRCAPSIDETEGHGYSGGQGGSGYGKKEAGEYWMAHNPTCDNLLHTPNWSLVQGSRMDNLENCHEFYLMSLPPVERLFQNRRDRWREKFNVEEKGLHWRVTDVEDKLAKEQKLNVDRQQEWIAACAKSNRELKSAHDEALKWKGLVASLMTSDELAKYMFDLPETTYDNGKKDGFVKGKAFVLEERSDHEFELFKTDCGTRFRDKRKEFDHLEFGILKAIEKLSRKGVAVDVLRTVLGDENTDAGAAASGGAGPSEQVNRCKSVSDRLACRVLVLGPCNSFWNNC